MKRHTAKTESPEEAAKRQEWIERLRNFLPPAQADEDTVARFFKALEIYRAEKAEGVVREDRLRKLRQEVSVPGFTRAGDFIPARYLPSGDAWEQPEPAEDVPPPPEVAE